MPSWHRSRKTGPAQTQRLVDEAIARFMPELAAEQRDRSADQRYFTIAHDQVSFAGTSRVYGELDLADALDLEDAVAAGARQLADLGSTDTLGVRRAAAVGILPRGEQALQFAGVSTGSAAVATDGGDSGEPERTETGRVPRRMKGRRRDTVLCVHLSEDALRFHDPDAPVKLDNAGGQLLSAGQTAEWCGRPDTDRIVVKPVRDLTAHHHPDDEHRVTDQGVESYPVPAAWPKRSSSGTKHACSLGATGRPGAATRTT